MANASIFAQYAAPRSIADYQGDAQRREANALTLDGVRRKNAMEDMALQKSQAKQNALMQIAQGWTPQTTVQERVASLRSNPELWGEADALEKADLDRQKTSAEVGDKNAGTAEKLMKIRKAAIGMVVANPTPEALEAVMADLEAITGVPAAQGRALFQGATTPEAIKERAMRIGLELDKQLPTMQTNDAGGFVSGVAIDPTTGKPIAGAGFTTQKTQSPDNAATQQTAAQQIASREREGAANRGVQLRGQNLSETAAQRRDRTTRDTAQAIIGKPLTEGQAKAVLFGARMEAANKILDDLEKKGVTASVPGSRAGYGIGAVITALSPADRQQLDQAKRDFINAVLRRESGAVIADSEFDNGDKQYFPQIGDSKEVIAQKKRNREIAMRGIQAEVPEARKGMFQQVQGLAPDAVPEAIGDASDPLGLRR